MTITYSSLSTNMQSTEELSTETFSYFFPVLSATIFVDLISPKGAECVSSLLLLMTSEIKVRRRSRFLTVVTGNREEEFHGRPP
jgi:hypothetical protein